MKYQINYTHGDIIDINVPSGPGIHSRKLLINDSKKALSNDSVTGTLKNIIKIPDQKDNILIAVSDATRKTGFHIYFPVMLKMFKDRGIDEKNIHIIFATGIHRPPTVEEMKDILGNGIYSNFKDRLYINDAGNSESFQYYGKTSYNTPVYINKIIDKFPVFILTGTIKFHYFAGFGGGRKTVLPGLASSVTIASNHSLSIDYENYCFRQGVSIGSVDNNMVSLDMQEAADMVKISGSVNTILNSKGEIIDMFAGDHNEVFKRGILRAKEIYEVPVNQKADIVIAAGTNYKNLLQLHKVLYNAHSALKDNGHKIIAAPCPEGIGSASYEKWMKYEAITGLIDDLRNTPDINGQTALSTKMKAKNTYIYTDIPKMVLDLFRFEKTSNVQETLDKIINDLIIKGNPRPVIYIMPQAGETIPVIK